MSKSIIGPFPGPDTSGHLPSRVGCVEGGAPKSALSKAEGTGFQGVFAGLCPVSLWANRYFRVRDCLINILLNRPRSPFLEGRGTKSNLGGTPSLKPRQVGASPGGST